MSHPLVVHCKKQPYDVYIGRPSKWGNHFSHIPNSTALVIVATREEAVREYEAWVERTNQESLGEFHADIKRELRGKVLGCWCAPQACHGEVLARIANE